MRDRNTARRRSAALATTAAIAALPISTAPAAPPATAAAKSYRNCTALHRAYPHGVGRPGAHDHTSGTPVTTFKRSSALYAHNDGKSPLYSGEHDLDRDNDGIACEKR